jgi:putative tryptophan/tyrosine transport system substrate-binding protein
VNSGLGQQMQFDQFKRREFFTLLGGAAAWPLAARAQRGTRLREITVWMGRANDAEGQRHAAAFREGLQALGWTSGRNVRIDYRWVTGDIDRMSLAKEVVEQQPDVILVETTPAVAALARESTTIPIVFVNVSDPIGGGFVASLAHPGGSITGFISNEPSIGGKWPEVLKEIAPGVGRVGFMFNPDAAPYAEAFMRPAETAANSLGMELLASRVHDDTEIEHAIIALGSTAGGGLIVLPDPTTNTRSALIVGLAAQYRVPAVYAWRFQAVGGGLISYGCDLTDSFRAAASYVDRILRGEKPATLPVQMPTKFSLVVNLKTAKALGLEVPMSLLMRLDEVIE